MITKYTSEIQYLFTTFHTTFLKNFLYELSLKLKNYIFVQIVIIVVLRKDILNVLNYGLLIFFKYLLAFFIIHLVSFQSLFLVNACKQN